MATESPALAVNPAFDLTNEDAPVVVTSPFELMRTFSDTPCLNIVLVAPLGFLAKNSKSPSVL